MRNKTLCWIWKIFHIHFEFENKILLNSHYEFLRISWNSTEWRMLSVT